MFMVNFKYTLSVLIATIIYLTYEYSFTLRFFDHPVGINTERLLIMIMVYPVSILLFSNLFKLYPYIREL